MSNSDYQILPDKWTEFYHESGETGMGYLIVTVILKNGSKYERVVINGGYVTQVYGFDEVPFDVDEIKEMHATHDKWNFNKDR